MTPKGKALELYDKYLDEALDGDAYFFECCAKKCTLVAIREILDVLAGIPESHKEIKYWEEVKQEIEKFMTPKEKAQDILLKIRDGRQFADNGKEYTMELMSNGNAKRIALFFVDEIVELMTEQIVINYWQQVKTEIEKL